MPGVVWLKNKQSPEPMLTYHQRSSVAFTWEQVLMQLIHNMCSEITLLQLLPHLPGVNVLKRLILWNLIITWSIII